jgi:hypothetical protein
MVFVSPLFLKKIITEAIFTHYFQKLKSMVLQNYWELPNIGVDLGCKSYWILNNFMNVLNKIKLEKFREIQASFGIVEKPYTSRILWRKFCTF